MLTVVFGESQVQFGYNRSKESKEDPDRPNMSTIDENIDAVKKIIFDNRRITIIEVADNVGIIIVKKLVRNAQYCGKTSLGFCTMITHQHTHRCLCVSFWPKIKS